MADTEIEYGTKGWSLVTGCTPVSAGCENCWARELHSRRHKAYVAGKRMPEQYAQPFSVVQVHPDRLSEPLRWRKAQRVLVAFGGDLFHEDVPFEFILRAWQIMAICSQHTFVILTKRSERMRRFITEWLPGAWGLATMSLQLLDVPLPNVWLGVSAEDQRAADERVPWLLQTPAAVRWLSAEPLLGEIRLQGWDGKLQRNYLDPDWSGERSKRGPLDLVIAGCESGTRARHCDTGWLRSLRDQCVAAGVKFYLKQMKVDGKLVKLPLLDGKVWAEYPK